MNKRKLLIICIAVLAVSAAFLTAGCKGPEGPSVYLEAEDGTRYYSGGSIYLGEVYNQLTHQFLSENFYLVNETYNTLTLNGSVMVALVMETRLSSSGSYQYTLSPPADAITLDTGALQTSISDNSRSGAIVFGMDATSGSYSSVCIRRRYLIEITDGSEDYDFIIDVFGYVLSSTGTW